MAICCFASSLDFTVAVSLLLCLLVYLPRLCRLHCCFFLCFSFLLSLLFFSLLLVHFSACCYCYFFGVSTFCLHFLAFCTLSSFRTSTSSNNSTNSTSNTSNNSNNNINTSNGRFAIAIFDWHIQQLQWLMSELKGGTFFHHIPIIPLTCLLWLFSCFESPLCLINSWVLPRSVRSTQEPLHGTQVSQHAQLFFLRFIIDGLHVCALDWRMSACIYIYVCIWYTSIFIRMCTVYIHVCMHANLHCEIWYKHRKK